MNQITTRPDQSPTEAPKAGGCCGGPKATRFADVRSERQAPVKAPVAKSGSCCCDNK